MTDEVSDPVAIHARFNALRGQLMKPPAIHPSRSQLNAFARLVREETSIPRVAINQESVLYGWYYAQDNLYNEDFHIEDMFGEHGIKLTDSQSVDWSDPNQTGREMAVQLNAAIEHQLAIDMGPFL